MRHYIQVDQNTVCVTHYTKGADGKWQEASQVTTLDATLFLNADTNTFTIPLARIYRRVLDAD